MTEPSDLEGGLFDHLCRVYVQRADERQRSMGLQYTEAETHDLAKECAKFVLAQRDERIRRLEAVVMAARRLDEDPWCDGWTELSAALAALDAANGERGDG